MSGRRKSDLSSLIIFISRWMFIACLVLICLATTGSAAKEKTAPPAQSLETIRPKSMNDINQLLSRLSDEQVRQMNTTGVGPRYQIEISQ